VKGLIEADEKEPVSEMAGSREEIPCHCERRSSDEAKPNPTSCGWLVLPEIPKSIRR